MIPSTSLTSGPFNQAVAQAVGSLRQAEDRLRSWRSDESSPSAELDLLHLTSLAMLAEQRGRHMLADAPAQFSAGPESDSIAGLATAHDALIAHFPGADDIIAFRFITEVEAVRQGMQSYVDSH